MREELVTSLRDDIVQMGIKVDVDEKRGILRIPEKALFFRVGHAEVDDPATVRKIGAVLLKTLKSEKYKGKIETVFIEGHTDSDPTGAGSIYASNWELSTQRAINTWNVMKSGDNKELAELKNDVVLVIGCAFAFGLSNTSKILTLGAFSIRFCFTLIYA